MTTHDAYDDTVAAYALDALDSSERQAFDEHLASCEICRAELAGFRRVAAGLAANVEPIAPPPDLKAKVLARATGRASSAPPVSRGPWLAAAAALVLAAGLGAYALALRSQVSSLEASVRELSLRAETLRAEVTGLRTDAARLTNVVEVLRAPDTLRVDLRGQGGAPSALGRAYVSRDGGLVLSVSAMPVLPPDRVYQIWVISPGQAPLSAGVFSVNPSGRGDIAVPLPPGAEGSRTVAITVEPGPAGSPRGTTAPILIGAAGD